MRGWELRDHGALLPGNQHQEIICPQAMRTWEITERSDSTPVDWAGEGKPEADKGNGERVMKCPSYSPGSRRVLHQGMHMERSLVGARCWEFMWGYTIKQSWVKHHQQNMCMLTGDLRNRETSGMVWSEAAILQGKSSWSDKRCPCH